MTEEGGDSNDIRSTYDEIDEEDEVFSSVLTNATAIQATRHARHIYFGELSPTANEQSVATYFSHVMSAIGGNTTGPGDAVVNVYINNEKKFAFVEMRYVEEASNAMALDGIIFEGARVKVRRPSDYNPSLAATLGPSQPNPNLNLGVVRGLPYYSTEAQVRELLESFVDLRGFDLVKDRETGNSKGYAFCVYQDLSVIDIACAATNGIKMGDRTLTVRRANQGQTQPKWRVYCYIHNYKLRCRVVPERQGSDEVFGALPRFLD
ncbi:splicing factor U2af large subunit B-like protein isoform X3 [Tanacetum coccineum]|uniref:Splicing factor U2af large subunit B-like protein isoform X3 n=1 Tax=Tanacetum coccineum TaxID=301880 RepID=A0ABQ4YTY3_9ASTR